MRDPFKETSTDEETRGYLNPRPRDHEACVRPLSRKLSIAETRNTTCCHKSERSDNCEVLAEITG